MRVVLIAALTVSSLLFPLAGAQAGEPSQPTGIRNTSMITNYEPDPKMSLIPEGFKTQAAHRKPRTQESALKPAK